MAAPKVCVLRAPGTNCDEETSHAFERAGASAQRIHLNEIVSNPKQLADYQVLCIPGGFSFGDDVGAGVLFASELAAASGDVMGEFLARDTLVLGICNGFQVLMKTGLLPAGKTGWGLNPADRDVTLTWNTSGRYDARWVHLKSAAPQNAFLREIDRIELPIAHAEGRIAVSDRVDLAAWQSAGQIGLCYRAADDDRPFNSDDAVAEPPVNPNGSIANIAALSDEEGRILGLMPHPERAIDATQHPQWTRRETREEGAGMKIFRNAVTYFA